MPTKEIDSQEGTHATEADNGRIYADFSHSFTDAWEKKDIEFTFRFGKPNKMVIKQMQKTAARDSAQASRNLLVNIIHPDDKAEFLTAAEEYPGLVTSFATAVIKAVGIGEVGN